MHQAGPVVTGGVGKHVGGVGRVGVPVLRHPDPLAVGPVHLVVAELADFGLLVTVAQSGLGVCTVGVHTVQTVLGRVCQYVSISVLEGTARYAGLLLDPAKSCGLRPRHAVFAYFRPFLVFSINISNF